MASGSSATTTPAVQANHAEPWRIMHEWRQGLGPGVVVTVVLAVGSLPGADVGEFRADVGVDIREMNDRIGQVAGKVDRVNDRMNRVDNPIDMVNSRMEPIDQLLLPWAEPVHGVKPLGKALLALLPQAWGRGANSWREEVFLRGANAMVTQVPLMRLPMIPSVF